MQRKMRASGRMSDKVKRAVIKAGHGPGGIIEPVINAVTHNVRHALRNSVSVEAALLPSVTEISKGAVRGAGEVGQELGAVCQGLMIGVVRSTKFIGSEAFDAMGKTAHTAVKVAAQTGGDVTGAAVGLVNGAIAGSKELNVDVRRSAGAAAQGAFDAAREVSGAVGETVRKALTEILSVIKVVLKEPLGTRH